MEKKLLLIHNNLGRHLCQVVGETSAKIKKISCFFALNQQKQSKTFLKNLNHQWSKIRAEI